MPRRANGGHAAAEGADSLVGKKTRAHAILIGHATRCTQFATRRRRALGVWWARPRARHGSTPWQGLRGGEGGEGPPLHRRDAGAHARTGYVGGCARILAALRACASMAPTQPHRLSHTDCADCAARRAFAHAKSATGNHLRRELSYGGGILCPSRSNPPAR